MQRNGSEWLKPLSVKCLKPEIPLACITTPIYWTSQQDYQATRFFFPERNKTMSALSQATVIIEASEAGEVLIQARAALAQKRRLFILNSCFETGLTWPYDFQQSGAIRVADEAEIIENLELETQT